MKQFMKHKAKTILGIAGLFVATQAAAQITFYERDGFTGPSFQTNEPIDNMQGNRASSAVVAAGNWQVCDNPRYIGNCVTLRPGQYPDLGAIGLNNRISSVRPQETYGSDVDRRTMMRARSADNQPRGDQRTLEAPVTSVRAVVGPAEKRCWVERETVNERGAPNIGGAIAGAVIGGVLGHQIGSGRGNDVATAGGAVAGAAVGSQVGRDQGQTYSKDVQRCATEPQAAAPAYYDVTYSFNGVEHRVQTTTPPGPTIPVDPAGNPRTG